MPQVKLNENGELVDINTGKVIGKSENGKLVMFQQDNTVPTVVENKAIDSVPATLRQEPNKASESQQKTVETQTNAPIKRLETKSSFIQKKTKYEVTKDTTFIVEFCLIERDGRFLVVKKEAVDTMTEAEPCWVKFRMWNYNEELTWKSQCMDFNHEIKAQFINNDKLNEKKIKELLLDWSFGEGNDRLKLLHTNGILSDESYNIFRGLFPNIASAIVNLMNDVLEGNQ